MLFRSQRRAPGSFLVVQRLREAKDRAGSAQRGLLSVRSRTDRVFGPHRVDERLALREMRVKR